MKYTEQKLTHFADFINNTVLAIKYYLSIAWLPQLPWHLSSGS